MKKSLISILVLASILTFAAIADIGDAFAKTTTIKIAVVMPEGSTWTNTLHEFSNAVEMETRGEVKFRIYAGGVSGDESDVLRKMRVNRLHAGGFSGVGLGFVLPEIRILEAPLLFRSYAEIDHVKQEMFDDFAKMFEKKGFVLLGFAEAGFVNLFSQNNISGIKNLSKAKMWVWKGDRVAENFLDAFGIKTYPLHLADVNTGLETGMIDAFYSPPLAAVAFQWYSRVSYMLDYPVVNSTGALLMNKRTFYTLSEKNREIVSRLVKQFSAKLVTLTRKDNEEAMDVIKDAGIRMILPTKEQAASFEKSAEKNYKTSIPGLYSQALFDKVQKILADYRKNI